MAFNLAPLFQSFGDIGSATARAKLLATDYRLKQIMDALSQQKEKAGISETEARTKLIGEQLKRLGLPQQAGITQGPQGETYGVTFTPEGGFKANQIIKGRDFASWQSMLHQMVEAVPAERKALATSIADYYSGVGEPDKAVQAIKELATKPEQRPEGAELQYLDALVREKGGQPLSSEEIAKAHEKYQPYGGAKIQILRSNLDERKKQDLVTDLTKLETITKRFDKIIEVGSNTPGYVSNPTGPGDAALLLAYVEAIRPQQGFRFTEAERKLFIGLRGVVDAAQARIMSGYEGTLFGPQGSAQRDQMAGIITNAMNQATTRKKDITDKFLKANPELRDIVELPPEAPAAAPAGGGTDLYLDAQGNLISKPKTP